jgi:hypothetical protein
MRALNVLLSVLVSAAIGLLVLEGGLRLIGFAPPQSITRFDSGIGWAKRANARVERSSPEFDIVIETNSIGLRDDELADPKPAGEHRVLCLGDSFVLGYTVDRADLFIDLLEEAWLAEGRKVQVINGGTEGWSTDQEVAWFLAEGADLSPDTVLLFPYENDITYCADERYTRYPKPRFEPDGSLEDRELLDPGRAPFLQRIAIGRFLGFIRTALRGAPSADHFSVGDTTIPREFAPLLNERPDFLADAEARARGAMMALKSRCDELGCALLVCPIPSESAIDESERARFQAGPFAGIPEDTWSPDRPVDFFLATAAELGIPAYDPRPGLREAQEDGPLYFEQEWHFTPLGNLLFASLLHSELSDSMPPATAPASEPSLTERPTRPEWPYWYAGLVALIGTLYAATYRKEEKVLFSYIKVACLLGTVFAIALGGAALLGLLSPTAAAWILALFILGLFGFILYKLGPRIDTILELLFAFVRRGHWYLMPLVTILVTIGSLLLVAASSPLIAPFIYTLF